MTWKNIKICTNIFSLQRNCLFSLTWTLFWMISMLLGETFRQRSPMLTLILMPWPSFWLTVKASVNGRKIYSTTKSKFTKQFFKFFRFKLSYKKLKIKFEHVENFRQKVLLENEVSNCAFDCILLPSVGLWKLTIFFLGAQLILS
jgi:hypothetical protein